MTITIVEAAAVEAALGVGTIEIAVTTIEVAWAVVAGTAVVVNHHVATTNGIATMITENVALLLPVLHAIVTLDVEAPVQIECIARILDQGALPKQPLVHVVGSAGSVKCDSFVFPISSSVACPSMSTWNII